MYLHWFTCQTPSRGVQTDSSALLNLTTAGPSAECGDWWVLERGICLWLDRRKTVFLILTKFRNKNKWSILCLSRIVHLLWDEDSVCSSILLTCCSWESYKNFIRSLQAGNREEGNMALRVGNGRGRWGEIPCCVEHLRFKTQSHLQSKLICVAQNGMWNAALPALLGMCILFPGSVGLNRAVIPSLQTIWHHLLWHGCGQNRLLESQSYFKTG